MTWDFAEGNPFSQASGNFLNNVDWVQKSIQLLVPYAAGVEVQHDAQTVEYPSNTVISSDPPYYDNIGYADLSDFFFCWMKPVVRPVFDDIFGVLATPKAENWLPRLIDTAAKKRQKPFSSTV
jgi:putative DNA methylase